ncbi:MAG: hypothetical protein RI947_185 [Candidatus Parcubacteria bacterium]|jgi:ABC-2 type transport system ATP-binding protein
MITVKDLVKTYETPIKSGSILRDIIDRQYKKNIALNHISFEIDENEFVGFIGPNGAGKTTTMKILSGILYPTEGSTKVLGYTPFEKNNKFLKQIAFVMGQKNQMLWELPAIDTFYLNKEIYEIGDASFKQRLQEMVELLACESFIDQPVKTLSLGQRMRVELIASLLHKPKILFLDEPTIGLDIFAQAAIIKFLKEYQSRYKTTVMLTSHYMQDVQRLAKRIIMIDHGTIIFDGMLKDLIRDYSEEKIINIIMDEPLEKLPAFISHYRHAYTFPQLKITIQKSQLHKILPQILESVAYNDVTIEDEHIEDIIKKIFKKKNTSS